MVRKRGSIPQTAIKMEAELCLQKRRKFNVLRVFGIEELEIRHCFMLKWLLSPTGDHKSHLRGRGENDEDDSQEDGHCSKKE